MAARTKTQTADMVTGHPILGHDMVRSNSLKKQSQVIVKFNSSGGKYLKTRRFFRGKLEGAGKNKTWETVDFVLWVKRERKGEKMGNPQK